MNNHLRTSKQLRSILDGNDSFVRGHQITKILRRKKHVPNWVYNNKAIRDMLLQVFPNMNKNPKQRFRAGRWVRVITLYYRRGWSRPEVAAELELSDDVTNRIIYRIQMAAKGLRTDGKKRLPGTSGNQP